MLMVSRGPKFSRIVVFGILLMSPVLVFQLLMLFYGGIQLREEIALAIYGDEIQILAVFAPLSTLFVAFTEFVKHSERTSALRSAAAFAICAILAAAAGIASGLIGIIQERYYLSAVLLFCSHPMPFGNLLQ